MSEEKGGSMESYLKELVREACVIRKWASAEGLQASLQECLDKGMKRGARTSAFPLPYTFEKN